MGYAAKSDASVASFVGVLDWTNAVSVATSVSGDTLNVSRGVYTEPAMRRRSGDVPRMRRPTRSRAPAFAFARTTELSSGITSESVMEIDAKVADPMSRSGR